MWQALHPSDMPAEGDVDTSRVAVKTYVPAYQKDEWQSHARLTPGERAFF